MMGVIGIGVIKNGKRSENQGDERVKGDGEKGKCLLTCVVRNI